MSTRSITGSSKARTASVGATMSVLRQLLAPYGKPGLAVRRGQTRAGDGDRGLGACPHPAHRIGAGVRALGPLLVELPARRRAQRRWQPTTCGFTMPTASMVANTLVGPTNTNPWRLSCLASSADAGVDATMSAAVRGA